MLDEVKFHGTEELEPFSFQDIGVALALDKITFMFDHMFAVKKGQVGRQGQRFKKTKQMKTIVKIIIWVSMYLKMTLLRVKLLTQ